MNNKTKINLISEIMSEASLSEVGLKKDDDYDGDTMHGFYVGVFTAIDAVLAMEDEDDG